MCHPWFAAFIFAWYSTELTTLHRQWCSLWSLVPPENTGRNWVNKSYNVLSLSLQLQGKTFSFQSHQSKRWERPERPLGLPCIPLRTECGVQGRTVCLMFCCFLFSWSEPGLVYNLIYRANSCFKGAALTITLLL